MSIFIFIFTCSYSYSYFSIIENGNWYITKNNDPFNDRTTYRICKNSNERFKSYNGDIGSNGIICIDYDPIFNKNYVSMNLITLYHPGRMTSNAVKMKVKFDSLKSEEGIYKINILPNDTYEIPIVTGNDFGNFIASIDIYEKLNIMIYKDENSSPDYFSFDWKIGSLANMIANFLNFYVN